MGKNVDPLTFQQSLVRQKKEEIRNDLPHVYGFKMYQWMREMYESTNRINLLCAGNQQGKSSCFIRKNIEWAGNQKIWSKIWPPLASGVKNTPKIFWYFYPSLEVATIEFTKKWVPESMPRGAMKNHETYGWDADFLGGEINAVHFRSGVSIYFKSYGQKQMNLQTSTVHMVTGDEEMPPDMVDELLSRLAATQGIFNQAFTATSGYELWYRAMECRGTSEEAFKTAFKKTVSLYDSQVYEDGTPGVWTLERIKEREAQCTSKNEVLKRVMGRFVKDEGRKYYAFEPTAHVTAGGKIPGDWKIFAGVDIGSGGQSAARSRGAITFIAANPEFTKGRVVKFWRGDHQETTATDILNKYREMKQGLAMTNACYDYNSREFGLVAARSGEPFVPADKARNAGDQILNTLFSAGALTLDEELPELAKLTTELMTVPVGTKNRKYIDDGVDSARYCAILIPWDFAKIAPGKFAPEEESDIPPVHLTDAEYAAWEIRQRRGEMEPRDPNSDWAEFYEEIEDWNSAYDGS